MSTDVTVVFFIAVLVFLPTSLSSHRYINVPGIGDRDDGEPLEHYLCNDTVSCTLSNTTLVLSLHGLHLLPNKSCVVSNNENLAIIGGNYTGISSFISCPKVKGGLTFFNNKFDTRISQV